MPWPDICTPLPPDRSGVRGVRPSPFFLLQIGDGDALLVVCCGAQIHGARAHKVNGDVLIHRMIDRSLIHIQDEVLMARGIIHSRDLHLEVREGLGAHLARSALSLVGRHAVGQAIFHKKARNCHLARSTTLL